MADLVVRATLRENILPQLAKIAAGMEALERQMEASQKRMSQQQERHSRRTNENLLKIDDSIRGAARRAAARVLLLGGAIAAAAGHAVALTAALWPMIGALGALPAIAVGGIASIAGLITGFAGLGAAMKKTGGGAGSSANQIAAAQRRVEMSNRSLRDSQESLNDAFEEARDRLRDIQTSYAGAQLDVEAAALAVRDAEIALRQARSSGDRQERLRADLALRQARLSQIEATNRLSDVEQEYSERMARGVEGSEEVRDATERHADALYELAEAQEALNDAMKGGGGGGDDAYSKLSQAGKELVDTFRALGPAWRQVREQTQQALFAGVASDMEKLSGAYLPVMLRQLPAFAQGWNNAFRGMAGLASNAGFVKDMDDSLGLQAVMWQRIGNSFAPFLSGFRHWVRVGSDFMPRLGNWVEKQAQRWELWSLRVRQTGEAHRWIENAITTGHKFNELIKSWGRSLFEVFRLGQDRSLLDNLIAGSKAFEAWLATAEGQQRIVLMWQRMRDLGSAAWVVIKQVVSILAQFDFGALATVLGALAKALGVVADNMGFVNAVLGPLVTAMLVYKTMTIALTVAKASLTAATRLFGIQLAAQTAAVDKDTAAKGKNAAATRGMAGAFGRLERALGPLALGFIGLDLAGDLWLDKLLGIGPMTGGLIDRTNGLNSAVGVTAEQYRDAADDLQEYSDLLRSQTDPAFAFAQAQERVAQAQAQVNETAQTYGEGSPQHVQAVRDLQMAMLDLNSAAVEAAKVNQDLLIPQLREMERQGLIAAGTADAVANSLATARQRAKELDGTSASIYIKVLANNTELQKALSGYYAQYGQHLAMQYRAKGGPVSAGEPYVVGEEGPEVFVPGQSGVIVPNGVTSGGSATGAQKIELTINLVGADSEMKRWFQKAIRVNGAKAFGLTPA